MTKQKGGKNTHDLFLLSHVIQLLTYAITIFAKQIPKKNHNIILANQGPIIYFIESRFPVWHKWTVCI